MQHNIYWGPLRKPIEWSLKTVLAPWAYIASVIYHDSFWYPMQGGDARSEQVLDSPWGRLFENWEQLTPDANGFPHVGEAPAARHARRHARLQTVTGHSRHLHQGSARVCQPPAAHRRRESAA